MSDKYSLFVKLVGEEPDCQVCDKMWNCPTYNKKEWLVEHKGFIEVLYCYEFKREK